MKNNSGNFVNTFTFMQFQNIGKARYVEAARKNRALQYTSTTSSLSHLLF